MFRQVLRLERIAKHKKPQATLAESQHTSPYYGDLFENYKRLLLKGKLTNW